MKKKEIIYKGDLYKSIKDLSRKLDISHKLLMERIYKGWPEERWDEKIKDYKIIYKGNEYESIKKLSEKINISSKVLRQRIKKGLPEEEWDQKVITREKISYQGKLFDSRIQLARKLGISSSALKLRIDKGWPEERWGEKKNKNKVLKRINIDQVETGPNGSYLYKPTKTVSSAAGAPLRSSKVRGQSQWMRFPAINPKRS